MSFTVSYRPDRISGKQIPDVQSVNNNQSSVRQQLAKVLFGKELPSSSNISFGWSDNLSEVEKKILSVLTSSYNHSAIVASHSFPDGDAYGSNIGISGILESMGKRVYSVIDYRPKKTFENVPSPDPARTATQYIRNLNSIKGLKKVDLVVITDSGEPRVIKGNKNSKSNFPLDLMCRKKPKTIIIIDHHPDEEGERTNQQKWLDEFTKRGISPKNVLYWREKRSSAAEMVAELDKEIEDESSKRTVKGYNKDFNHAYRLAMATGIMTDAGGTTTKKGEIDKTKFARLSYAKSKDPAAGNMSATRYAFEWLVNHSDVDKKEIDSTELISKMDLDPEFEKKVKGVVTKETKIKGVDVKLPTKSDPLGYICLKNWDGLEKLAKEANDKRVSDRFVYKIIKSAMVENLMNNKNAGVYVLANQGKDGRVFLTLRSYGFDYTKGELHKPGHVFGDSLALKITNKLEGYHGTGGGHKNACGFKSNKNVDFYNQILPFIEEVVEDYREKHPDLTEVPDDKLQKLKSIAFGSISSY